MNTFHKEKVAEEIQHLAGRFVSLESNRDAMITVTHTIISDDAKYATVMVTVFPDSKERAVLEFLKRKRKEFKEFVKDNSKIGRVPFFDFEIDIGQKMANDIYNIT